MARRKNPIGTFVLLLAVLGFGWASWHYFVEERIHDHKEVPTPPAEEIGRLRAALTDALSTEEGFLEISSFNWRANSNFYRVDLQMRDGTSQTFAKAIAKRASDLVERATQGIPAHVQVFVLGRDVAQHIP
jgi:hypothetical protein